ncbi:MAG: 30S ribosomal protein S3 [Patescibacteria group bacterium]|nr:30S ribosomal protein S3 [Patescibacteria group bacterium]
MGQKVNPKSFRLLSIYSWDSNWFSEKEYSKLLRQDILIKDYLKEKSIDFGIDKINIQRSGNTVDINIYSSKPGIIIGRGGAGIENLRKNIVKKFFKEYQNKKNKPAINLNIKEVKDSRISAELTAQAAVSDLEKRMPFRRVMKQMADRVYKSGAKGVKVMIAGRLNGAEIARTEYITLGNLPLHTLRADIDYSYRIAYTTYGTLGVKVWVYKGDIFKTKK